MPRFRLNPQLYYQSFIVFDKSNYDREFVLPTYRFIMDIVEMIFEIGFRFHCMPRLSWFIIICFIETTLSFEKSGL